MNVSVHWNAWTNTTNWQTDITNSLMIKPNWNERTEKRHIRRCTSRSEADESDCGNEDI